MHTCTLYLILYTRDTELLSLIRTSQLVMAFPGNGKAESRVSFMPLR